MALTTVKLGMFKDDYMNYVALDPAEYDSIERAFRQVLSGRTINAKYIEGLLTEAQKSTLYTELVAGTLAIDLTV